MFSKRLPSSGWSLCAFLTLFALLVLTACSSPAPPEVGSRCDRLEDCLGGDNLICVDNACAIVRCDEPADCTLQTTCVGGLCVPRECDVPESCEEGSRCWEGICVEGGCGDKTDCSFGEVCLGTPPTCSEPPELCSNEDDCPIGEGCNLNTRECALICSAAGDCPGQLYCLDELCRQPCRDGDDCPGERSCVEGRCRQLPDCSDRAECSGLRRYRDVSTCECVSCLESSDCDQSRQEVCTSSGQCTYCPQTASTEEDCTSNGQIYVDGCCADCSVDADCTSSRSPYCHRGRCSSAPGVECISQNDCEGDLACDRGRCVEPPSFDECQNQSDCPEGEACYADGLCRTEAETCGGCPGESRCVAERADELGTCAGCTTICDDSACPDGQTCFVDDGADEGYCADAYSVPQCLE